MLAVNVDVVTGLINFEPGGNTLAPNNLGTISCPAMSEMMASEQASKQGCM